MGADVCRLRLANWFLGDIESPFTDVETSYLGLGVGAKELGRLQEVIVGLKARRTMRRCFLKVQI